MKFLLFFVSFIYSIIFYSFHNLSKWKNIFWHNIQYSTWVTTPNAFGNTVQENLVASSFSWNLLIESFIFLFIWIIFLYIFSDLKSRWQSKLVNYKIIILYFLYYIFLIFYVYFYSKNLSLYYIILIIIFIFFDSIFNHISQLSAFKRHKINLKYVWLIANYITTFISIYYINKEWIHFITFYILLFNIFFNILVHKKYINYISLFISIVSILFLIYSLFFLLIKLYVF
jgi:hypothetical protein